MKPALYLIVFMTFSLSYAQLEDLKIKYDSTQQCGFTQFELIYSKGKTFVYDLVKKEFVIEKSKNFFHFFALRNSLMELDTKGKINVYDLNEGFKLDTVCQNRALFGYDSRNKVRHYVNDKLWYNRGAFYQYYGLDFIDGYVSVNEFERYVADHDLIPLIDQFGEDSIRTNPDGTQEVVYLDDSYPDIEKSGLYHLKSKEWIMPLKYGNVDHLRGVFVGNYLFNQEDYKLQYDFVKVGKKGIEKREVKDGVWSFPYDLFFEKGTYRVDRNPGKVILDQGEKKGVVWIYVTPFQLQNDYENIMSWDQRFNLTEDTMAYDNYDWIISNGLNSNGFFFEKDGKIGEVYFEIYGDYYKEGPLQADSSVLWERDYYNGNVTPILDQVVYKIDSVVEVKGYGGRAVFGPSDMKSGRWKRAGQGVIRFSDSTIYSHYFQNEQQGEPVVMMDQYGEDSMIVNEDGTIEAVYFPPEPGLYESGVFNIKTRKWVVEPRNAAVYPTTEGYVCEYPVLNEYYNVTDWKYKLQKYDGSVAFKDLSYEEFSSKHPNLLVPIYKIDSLYRIGREDKYDPTLEDIVYFKSAGMTGVANIRENYIVQDPAPFLYYDPSNEAALKVENEVLTIQVGTHKMDRILKDKEVDLLYYPSHELDKITVYDRKMDSWIRIQNHNKKEGFIVDNDSTGNLKNNFENFEPKITMKSVEPGLLYIENQLKDYEEPEVIFYDDYDNPMVDENGDEMHPMFYGYERSGLFDTKKNSWVVPPHYNSMTGSFASFTVWINIKEGKPYYSVYQNEKLIVHQSERKDLIQHAEFMRLLKEELDADSLVPAIEYNENHYYVNQYLFIYKEGKKALFELEKMSFLVPFSDILNFSFESKVCLTLTEGNLTFNKFFMSDKESKTMMASQLKSNESFSKDKKEACHFGFERYENLLISTFYGDDVYEPLFDQWGEDSVIWNPDGTPEYVTILAWEAFNQSGVYNLETKSWIIPPVNHKIYHNGKGQFAARTRKLVNGDEVESWYSIYNASGELLHDKKHAGDLPKEVLDWLDPLILE